MPDSSGSCAPARRSIGFLRGYQRLGSAPRRPESRLLACVNSPHPLSGGLPRMRAAAAVFWAGAHDLEKMPSGLTWRRERFAERSCSCRDSCRGNTCEMANVVVVGAQWGDEGKGKIVDWFPERSDIVLRFQGGKNAGYTLVINGETYKLALLPSGVLRPSKLAVIGNGVVFDPQAFLDEAARLKGQGVAGTTETLGVAETVTLILPLHRELDALRESSNAITAIGTTKRGIGPAYEDKVGRRAIRLMDLADLDTLPHKIDRLL